MSPVVHVFGSLLSGLLRAPGGLIAATPVPVPSGSSTSSTAAPALQFPTLLYSFLIWGTLIFAIVVLFMPDRTQEQRGRIRSMALGGTGVALFFAIWAVQTQANQAEFGTGGRPLGELLEQHRWLDSFAVTSDYHLDGDGISLPLLLIATAIFLCVALATWRNDRRVKLLTVCLLVLETSVSGVLLANDWVLFLFFWSLPVVPVYLMAQGWGHAGATAAASRYAITTLVSTGLLAVAACLIAFQGGTHSFNMQGPPTLPGFVASISFWLCAAAFLLVMAVVPLHMPLLDLERETGGALAAVTAAVLPTLGAFGFIHVAVGLFPTVLSSYSLVFAALAGIGSIWSGIAALRSDDLRRRIGYLGTAMMSAALLGASAHTNLALTGATFLLLARALVVSVLMLLCSGIQERTRTTRISQLGGLAGQAPRMAGFWVVTGLTAAGAPFLAGFAAEFLLFTGSFPSHRLLTTVVLAGVLVSAASLLWAAQRIFFGSAREAFSRVRDLSTLELTYTGLLLGLILLFGILPNRFAQLISNGASSLLYPGGG